VLRDLLTGSGYTVMEAADGEAGVAKAKSVVSDRRNTLPGTYARPLTADIL
jgi:hypothetical protein